MTTLHTFLVQLHVLIGALALVLFWVPMLSVKGSLLHRRGGRAYTVAMYTVAISAMLSSSMVLLDPIGIRRPEAVLDPQAAAELAARFRSFSLFLLMLGWLVFVSLRHGLAAVRERHTAGPLTAVSHQVSVALLGLLALLVGAVGVWREALLFMIFAVIGLLVAIGMYRDVRATQRGDVNLLAAHLGGLIGSGIGAYTAFFAFGGSQILGDLLPGQWKVLPWVLPSVIGYMAIKRWTTRLQKPRATPSASR